MLIVLAANVEHSNVLLALVFMLVAAKVLAEVFKRLRQPAIVSKISAGVLFGHAGGIVHETTIGYGLVKRQPINNF